MNLLKVSADRSLKETKVYWMCIINHDRIIRSGGGRERIRWGGDEGRRGQESISSMYLHHQSIYTRA